MASRKDTSSTDTRRLEHFGNGFSVTGASFSMQAEKGEVRIVSKNPSSNSRRLSRIPAALVNGVMVSELLLNFLLIDVETLQTIAKNLLMTRQTCQG